MQELFTHIPDKHINLYILVLTSEKIHHRVEREENGWSILVPENDIEVAEDTIQNYFEENKQFNIKYPLSPIRYEKTYMALWVCLILSMIHLYVDKNNLKPSTIEKLGASASKIVNGELHRATTALFLHSDQAHLIGNIIGFSVFGTYVWSICGWGLGSFFILITGILGNLTNAYLYQVCHVSVGASTSVFGAVGILSGRAIIEKTTISGNTFRRFLPIGSGIALLGMFSAGERTDVLAHFFGFCYGILGGLIYEAYLRKTIQNRHQLPFFLFTLFILFLAILRSLYE